MRYHSKTNNILFSLPAYPFWLLIASSVSTFWQLIHLNLSKESNHLNPPSPPPLPPLLATGCNHSAPLNQRRHAESQTVCPSLPWGGKSNTRAHSSRRIGSYRASPRLAAPLKRISPGRFCRLLPTFVEVQICRGFNSRRKLWISPTVPRADPHKRNRLLCTCWVLPSMTCSSRGVGRAGGGLHYTAFHSRRPCAFELCECSREAARNTQAEYTAVISWEVCRRFPFILFF